MKIIQLCPNLNQGGVERGIIEISKILDNQKDIVNYVCSNGGQLVSELKDSKHYKLSIHKKNPINIVINSFKLAKYIKDNEIDIIHAHSRAPAWVGYLASKLTNTKYITTYHGIYSYHNIFKKWY